MLKEFRDIIEARGWNDPNNNKGLVRIMENIEARLTRRLPRNATFALTTFQKKVLSAPQFWRDWSEDDVCRHLVIQGATSAGKTLLSELNILDTLQHDKQAVVLVPLKAMVHERAEHFEQDMLIGDKYRVYGASSDHMENDERLINGDYDVAVIVYEKFFSMLSQGSAKIMERCGLVVVDELSMLSKDQRGPKLEMALEIIQGRCPDARIMCLATCDCDTHKICKWLDPNNALEPIVSTARPVALEEHILQLNGSGIYRVIPADCEQDQADLEKREFRIDIPGYRSDWRIPQRKKALLLAILRKIYGKDSDARLLIFVGSQTETVDIAHFLRSSASEWFPRISHATKTEQYNEFFQKVNSCDRDDGQEELIDALLPHGIAYHHAGISTTLREVIEEEFQNPESLLKVIVATETLTVGVNMPFDAMVMISNKVPRGVGGRVPLTMQEYRNYIGRAGRLGQSNRSGETYLFVETSEDMEFYWRSYYNRESIVSALTRATEEELAPYYLSLLTNQVGTHKQNDSTFTAQQLQQFFDTSLSKVCNPRTDINPERLYQHLYSAYLASEEQNTANKGRGAEIRRSYAIAEFGTHIAPYAFSIDTCINIYWDFCEGYRHGGMPLGITQKDIESDRYLLEILYHVCLHTEIASSSSLTYPNDHQRPDRTFRARSLVLQKLRDILSEKDERGNKLYNLWCDDLPNKYKGLNDLWVLMNQTNIANEGKKLQAALRTILLFYWTKGHTIKEIKNLTNFHTFTKVISGDIERLAELVSFHLDAIHKCLTSARNPEGERVCETSEALSAFYALQTRVKYGMPRDLVQCANKHIYGLDRSRLLDLKSKADLRELTPIQYLYLASDTQLRTSLTQTQQAQLLQALERRGSVREFDTLMDIVSKDVGTKLTTENSDCLRNIAAWDGISPNEFYDNLKKLLKNEAFKDTRLGMDGDVHCITWRCGGHELCIGLPKETYAQKPNSKIQSFFAEHSNCPQIIVVPCQDGTNWDTHDVEQVMRDYNCTSLMDTTYFAMILANTIRIDLGGGYELFEFLADARGIFTKYEYSQFSLGNYIKHEEKKPDKPQFRLLCSNNHEFYARISDLQVALSKTNDMNNFEILPWGSELLNRDDSFCDCPTIVILEKEQICRSESLSEFLYKMRQQNFDNCLLLLNSTVAAESWNAADNPGNGCNRWNPQYSKIKQVIVDDTQSAIQEIRRFVTSWRHKGYLIGISYAHFDSPPPEHETDIRKIQRLAERLAEEYGTHRILFDQFSPAKELFTARGKERSLAAYGECRLYLILWNYWTKENVNCQNERVVIQRRCENDEACCLYLQSGRSSDPDVPAGHFSHSLTERPDDLLAQIIALLER